MSHTSGFGPQLLMLALADLNTATKKVVARKVDGVVDYMQSVSFFGVALRRALTLDGLESPTECFRLVEVNKFLHLSFEITCMCG